MKQKRQHAMLRAIKAAGGTGRLAEALGINPSAISQWDRVPVERVLRVEEITGVSRHALRPDIYPPPSKKRKAA